MIVLTLNRYSRISNSAPYTGELIINGLKLGVTLEHSTKALPPGIYRVSYCNSPKFGRELPLIFNEVIPASRGFRIHAGNSEKDTDGCILLGTTLKNSSYILKSTDKVNVLCSILEANRSETIILEIK